MSHVSFANAVNANIPRLERNLRVHQSLPFILKPPVPNMHDADLADARKIRVGGFNINHIERQHAGLLHRVIVENMAPVIYILLDAS